MVVNYTIKEGLNVGDLAQFDAINQYITEIEKKALRFEPILEYMPVGIEVCDENGNILFVNENFFKITRISKEDRLNKNIRDVNGEGLLAQVLESQKTVINAITTAPGYEGQGLANGFPLYEKERFIGAVIIIKDVSQAIELSRKLNEKESHLSEIYKRSAKYYFSDIVATDKNMKHVLDIAKEVAQNNQPVLLVGEIGTGKDLFARAIHSGSSRYKKPFVKFSCSRYPDEQSAYELFGYEKNAVPNAQEQKIGILELSTGGTLYIDGIDELSVPIQSKLVHSLCKKEITKIGGSKTIPLDVRIIVSINGDLKSNYEKGQICKEVYEILQNHIIKLIPLKDRSQDIEELTFNFTSKLSKKMGKNIRGITSDALEVLKHYPWPGNVTELKAKIMLLIKNSDNDHITKEMVMSILPSDFTNNDKGKVISLEEVERIAILNALEYYGNSLDDKKEAAKALQISLGTLYNKMKKYDLKFENGYK
jgi:PAS domain S-box-containing protein